MQGLGGSAVQGFRVLGFSGLGFRWFGGLGFGPHWFRVGRDPCCFCSPGEMLAFWNRLLRTVNGGRNALLLAVELAAHSLILLAF